MDIFFLVKIFLIMGCFKLNINMINEKLRTSFTLLKLDFLLITGFLALGLALGSNVTYSFFISPCIYWTMSSSIANSLIELTEAWEVEILEFGLLVNFKIAMSFLMWLPYITTFSANSAFLAIWASSQENTLLLRWEPNLAHHLS